MLSTPKESVRKKTLEKIEKAEIWFADQWLIGAQFVNKSVVNKMFGRTAANTGLSRFFNVTRRGSNLSGKLTEIVPRDLDDFSTDRQQFLLDRATNHIQITLDEPPTAYDLKSVICVQRANLNAAVKWCIDHRKFHLIVPVRILMTKDFWEVFYREKTHRYYATWPFCLTNWPSELRRLILSGVDFDLNNAIGQFVLESVGSEISKYPEAGEYLTEPKKARAKLCALLNVDGEQAKKVLHATVNGCGTSETMIKRGKSALTQIINESQALKYIECFSPLIKQLKQIRKAIAPDRKSFMRAYFAWEKSKTGTFFNGTGLVMHDGIDGCSISTIIPAQFSDDIKQSASRGVWDEESVFERLVTLM